MTRVSFFFSLGALGTAFLLILASVAFGPASASDIGLGLGICAWIISLWFTLAAMHVREWHVGGRRLSVWSTLAGLIAAVAAWETIQAAVFLPSVSRWLTLANGLVLGGLGCTGLIVHEVTTERVVHVLEVVEREG
jgi:hypothetical protein